MKVYAWPEWARRTRGPRPEMLTAIEQDRLRLNAHIPISDLARLMKRSPDTLREWARANGIGRSNRGWRAQRTGTRPAPPKRPVGRPRKRPDHCAEHDAMLDRLVSLARVASRGGKSWQA